MASDNRADIVLFNLSLLAVFLIVVVFSYALVAEVFFNSCGLSVQVAEKRILNSHMLDKDPNASLRLWHRRSTGTCSHEFQYSGSAGEFSFVIISTWHQGVKLTYWDHNRPPL